MLHCRHSRVCMNGLYMVSRTSPHEGESNWPTVDRSTKTSFSHAAFLQIFRTAPYINLYSNERLTLHSVKLTLPVTLNSTPG